MRAKISFLLAISLLFSIVLASCGGEVPICNPEDEAQLPTQAENEALWEEIGMWNATTVEEASEVAGFEVVGPSFIPDGFCRGQYIEVQDPCATFPEGLDCGRSIQVTQFLGCLEDESLEPGQSVFLVLFQSLSKFSAGAIPTEVGDYPATRDYQVAQDDRPAILSLSWEIDGMSFMLTGTIIGPLTEELMYEIAASVKVD